MSKFAGDQLPLLKARAMIDARFGSEVLLELERQRLPELLETGESVYDVERAGRGFHTYGILAVTDRRLIHIQFRHVLKRFRLFLCEYNRLDAVTTIDSFRAKYAQLDVHYDGRRVIHFVMPQVAVARTEHLRMTIARAAGLED